MPDEEEINVTVQAIASAVDALPAGWIRIFLGAIEDIPAGWLLCDGANGTPDLRGTFIRGALSGQGSGAIGGSDSHQHSIDICSEYCGCHCHWVGGDTSHEGSGLHSHQLFGDAACEYHCHGVSGYACPSYCDYIEVDYGACGYYASDAYHSHDVCGYADSEGHSHSLSGYTDCAEGYHSHELAGYTTYDGDHSHRVYGLSERGNNLPPHYDVLFIMKA